MSEPEIAKFCAGATIVGWNVESIHPPCEIATPGTLAAFAGLPSDNGFPEFVAWLFFGILGLCFLLALATDTIETKGGA